MFVGRLPTPNGKDLRNIMAWKVPPCFVEEFDWVDRSDRKHLFTKSVKLLKLVCARCAATMLAEAVTADDLPPELVDMVRDYICDDDELRAAS